MPNDAASPARRQFLARLSVALSGVAMAAVAIPVIGFLVAPLVHRIAGVWRPIGPASTFRVGETVRVTFTDPSPVPWSGQSAESAAWLRRQGAGEEAESFIAFSVNCTHLGCPVRWVPTARLFMCPCHGGVFYEDGRVAAGPPLHPLVRYPVRVMEGMVEIWTSPVPIM